MELLAFTGALLTVLALFPGACAVVAAQIGHGIEELSPLVWSLLGAGFWLLWAIGMIGGAVGLW